MFESRSLKNGKTALFFGTKLSVSQRWLYSYVDDFIEFFH